VIKYDVSKTYYIIKHKVCFFYQFSVNKDIEYSFITLYYAITLVLTLK